MKRFLNEGVLSIVLILLTMLFLDPFMLWMPTSLVFTLIAGIMLTFATFSAFVWREKSLDERDEYHKLIAARVGFLAGAGVLLFGIIWQTLDHALDPWLVYALIVMILGKLLALHYGKSNL